MTNRALTKPLFALLLFLLSYPALAQEAPASSGPATASAAPVTPPAISLTQIADQSSTTSKLISSVSSITVQPLDLEVLSEQLVSGRKQVLALQADTNKLMSNSNATVDQLNSNQTQWLFINDQLSKAQHRFKARSAELESALSQLSSEEDRWQQIKTLVSTTPELNYKGTDISDSLAAIAGARKMFAAPLQQTIAMDKDCQELLDIVAQELAGLKHSENYLRSTLFSNFHAPIWLMTADDFKSQADNEKTLSHKLKLSKFYLAQHLNGLAIIATVVFMVGFFIWRVRVNNKRKQEGQMGIAMSFPLLDRPFSTMTSVGVATAFIALPNPPQMIFTLLCVLLFFPVIRLGFPRLLPIVRPLAWLVSIFFIINSASVHIHAIPALLRFWLLVSAVIGLIGCARALIKFSASSERKSFVWRFLRASVWLALFAALAAAFGCIFGAVSLAQFLVTTVAYSAYAGLWLVVVAGVIMDIITAAIYLPSASASHLISRNRPTILNLAKKLTTAFCVISWLNFVMKRLTIRDPFLEDLLQVINYQISIGSITFSLGDLLAIAFTIWISFKISQLLRFLLVEDIAPRAKWARGVPEAVSTISQYCIVLAGFMAAISLAGIDISKLSILIGALGVGIGIGLQDVVNNFTSGLILLFEQKVKQSDIVQCSGVYGKVANIGMRCSVVRTFDGAEVIVPNGQLVSAQVINWTHSDQERRITIPVGVSYQADPQLALDTLLDIAKEDADVLENPPPLAFFTGFGASSLNFELRAWVNNGDIINEVNSRLCVAIYQQFKTAGIGIPYPQQDIYIKSWPAGAGGNA